MAFEQYKKTFAGMQALIALVTIGVMVFIGVHWTQAAMFFGVMQVAAVLGAFWAARIKGLAARRADALPLKGIN
jgi:hypothetical protein